MFRAAATMLAVGLMFPALAHGQDDSALARPAPLAQSFSLNTLDSGWVQADAIEPGTLFAADVGVPDARWVRLVLDDTTLAGTDADAGAWLTITSLQDGAVQYLNAESLRQWGFTSAYFNGSIVRVELWSPAGLGASRVRVRGVYSDALAGDLDAQSTPPGDLTAQDLCGGDDRVPSTDNRMGRLAPAGCTAWMFNDTNRSFLSAGHCSFTGNPVVQFNVPLSTATGSWVNPPPDDQYSVDTTSVQFQNGGAGSDWSYFGVFPNSNHGLMPAQRYGQWFTLAPSVTRNDGALVRVTGYGSVSPPVSLTLNNVQTTGTGPTTWLWNNTLLYSVDTTGGNSGSPVIDETGALGPVGSALAIHTHQGCTVNGNQGTISTQANLAAALNNPAGIARTGRGTVAGRLFAIGDRANNFGTVSVAPANFARIATVGARWQGLAYDYTTGLFFAIDASRNVYSLTESGAATLLGTATGTAATLTGLAFDPFTGRLLAVDPATGQIYQINRTTWQAAPVGAALGGTHRALEFDVLRRVLWSVDQSAAATLVRIDPVTLTRTVVGPLGAGMTAAGDLAADPADGQLYALNAANGDLMQINPLSAATLDLGATRGLFGSAFGLAVARAPGSGFTPIFNGSMLVDDTFGNGNGNGRIEPGENRVRLWLHMLNGGAAQAVFVLGTAESLSPTVAVVHNEATWPALQPGTASYNDTPFVLAVDPSHPCGAPIRLRVRLGDGAGESVMTISVPTGQPTPLGTPVKYAYTTPAVSIPADNQTGVSTTVVVPANAPFSSIAKVTFGLDSGGACSTNATSTAVGLNHSWVGDLVLRLTSPAGTTVDLMVRPGGENNNGRNFCNTVLDDAAATSIQSVTPAQAPYSGTFRPATALASFNGQDPRGTWTLTVIDNVVSDTGSIRRWSISITPPGPSVCGTQADPAIDLDYNRDGFLNLDDLGDYITDFYAYPAIPGPGGYAAVCPNLAPPYGDGYRVGYASDGAVWCEPPNLDALGDYLTDFYLALGTP